MLSTLPHAGRRILVSPQRSLRDWKARLPFLGGAATPESLSETLDSVYTTTWQLMRDEVIDNIFKATPFWYWLTSRNRIRQEPGGRWIGASSMYAKNTTVASLGVGGTVDVTPVDPLTTLKYDWKYVAGSVVRLFAEEEQNRGQQQIANIFEAKVKNLELSLVDKFETMALGDGTGGGGLDMLGIQAIVQNTPSSNPANPPGNIGGVDGATNSWWRNATRTYSTTGMLTGDTGFAFNARIMYNTASVGNDHPTLLLTYEAAFEAYEAGLVNVLRVLDNEFGDIGFEALRYKGAALTWSPSSPAGNLYFLNERYLELVVSSNAFFKMTDWKPIPNQLDRVAQIVVMGNLITTNRRMQGVVITLPF